MKTSANKPTRRWWVRVAGAFAMLLPAAALAANGLTLTGFGSASAGLGGVDLAVSKDTTALNANPAGLAQSHTQAMDVYLEPFYTLDNAHDDAYNRKQDVDNRTGAIFGAGYSHPLAGGEFVAGIGLFSQGGVGYVYDDLNTKYGTRDDLSAIFGIFKLTPGLAWNVSDHLRLGAALGINYAVARQKFFPATSFFDANHPETAFFGTRLDSLTGWGFNGKFGVQVQPVDALTLALTYTSKIPLNLDKGTTTVNFDAIGLSRVRYREASLHGIALPQDIGAGATYRVNSRWLIGGEFNWQDYSKALKALTLKASDPDDTDATPSIFNRQAVDFRDVTVYGLGVEYQLDPGTALRAGYSHANTGIPPQNLSPVLALINKNVISAGFAKDLSAQWNLGAALEYQFRNEVKYTNTGEVQPFGINAKEINQALLMTIMVSRRW